MNVYPWALAPKPATGMESSIGLLYRLAIDIPACRKTDLFAGYTKICNLITGPGGCRRTAHQSHRHSCAAPGPGAVPVADAGGRDDGSLWPPASRSCCRHLFRPRQPAAAWRGIGAARDSHHAQGAGMLPWHWLVPWKPHSRGSRSGPTRLSAIAAGLNRKQMLPSIHRADRAESAPVPLGKRR